MEEKVSLTIAYSSQVTKGDTQTLAKDGVLIVEAGTPPKVLWDLGRTVETLPEKEGHVRACVVMMGNQTLVRRPVEELLFRK